MLVIFMDKYLLLKRGSNFGGIFKAFFFYTTYFNFWKVSVHL